MSRALAVGIDGRELQGRPTGTGRYLRNLLRHWREADARLVVFFKGPPPEDTGLRHPRIELRPLATGGRGLLWQERTLSPAASRERLDVFFSPAYSCPLRLRLPRVTAVHDLSFRSLPQDFAPLDAMRRRLLVGASLRASKTIIAISDFTRREIAAWHPDAAGRVEVVHLGADDDLAPGPDRQRARRALDARGPLLLSVGAILNRRRLPTLIGALGLVRREHHDVALHVVGENRTQPRLDFAALLRERGLERSVRLSGFVDEVALARHYAAADVSVWLSEYEGFGLPILEAMARGLPVVASRRPAHAELFADAAVLVDPGSESDVAAAIAGLIESPERRSQCAARGRALAASFSWQRCAERHWRLLEACVR